MNQHLHPRLARAGLTGLAAATVSGTALAVPAQAATGRGSVVVVHGLRGVVADISVDGKQVLTSFAPQRITDPLALAPGSHRVVVKRASDHRTLVDRTVAVPAGRQVALVAYLDAAGKPSLGAFSEATPKIGDAKAVLRMRNVAAVGAVRLMVDGHRVGGTVTSGHQVTVTTSRGQHRISVWSATGSKTALVPPQTLAVAGGNATDLFLIGSQKNSSLTWLARTVSADRAFPAGVPTGSSGLAAPERFPVLPVGGLLALAGAALAFALTGRRRTA